MFITMEDHLKMVRAARTNTYLVENFGKYCSRDELGRFLVRYELFRKILNVKGSILECGVRSGSGLMQWMQLSNMLEPLAHMRVVYGFDTFAGFPSVTEHDLSAKVGDMKDDCYDDLLRCIAFHDNALLVQTGENTLARKYPWERIKLVKGDFLQTADPFLEQHQYLVVALMFLDFDLYEPTKKAIETFLPRMPKGSIIAFDELNNHCWPGETRALMETIGIGNHRIEKMPFDMNISWIEL